MEAFSVLQVPRSISSTMSCSSFSSSLSLASPSYSNLSAVRSAKTALSLSAFGAQRLVTKRHSLALKIHAAKQTFSSFDDMIKNSKVPVLVDFYAAWCGPCQLMAPVLSEVGAALKDQINVVKVDTEKYPQVATRYRIQALPTLVLFVNGKALNYLEGAQPKEKLIAHITHTLNAEKANIGQ